MKRWFSAIISHLTVRLSNLFGRKGVVGDKGLEDGQGGLGVDGREDAKEVASPTPTQIHIPQVIVSLYFIGEKTMVRMPSWKVWEILHEYMAKGDTISFPLHHKPS